MNGLKQNKVLFSNHTAKYDVAICELLVILAREWREPSDREVSRQVMCVRNNLLSLVNGSQWPIESIGYGLNKNIPNRSIFLTKG
ncbi:hypothetical protein DC094_09850 [Pelagibaculum spongiae]|uniref:Uncharacterized protein n=1 Tax=Pelagibaculum spongiae TaxID=2080658 RepID=A0A2V1GV86_9GAMM|nr:hypothetical protein DC094_09850 [Pelagibaculum spongiae]